MYGSSSWFVCAVCGAVIKPGSMLVVASPDGADENVDRPSAFDEDHWPPSSGRWRILYEGKAESAPEELRRS